MSVEHLNKMLVKATMPLATVDHYLKKIETSTSDDTKQKLADLAQKYPIVFGHSETDFTNWRKAATAFIQTVRKMNIKSLTTDSSLEKTVQKVADEAIYRVFAGSLTEAGEGRQTAEEAISSLAKKTTVAQQKAFIEMAARYPAAFGAPEEPITDWKQGVRQFVNTYADLKSNDLEEKQNISEIDETIAGALGSFLSYTLTPETVKTCMRTIKIGAPKNGIEYEKLLANMQTIESISGRVHLVKHEHTQFGLSGEGNFTFPGDLKRVSPDIHVVEMPGVWIQTLSKRIAELENLVTLNLADNAITTVPDEIGKLRNLRILDLSDNILMDLPEGISYCHSLEQLNLSGNKIKRLPETILHLATEHKLKMIDLRGNPYEPTTQDERDLFKALLKNGVQIKLGLKPSSPTEKPGLGGLLGILSGGPSLPGLLGGLGPLMSRPSPTSHMGILELMAAIHNSDDEDPSGCKTS